MGPDGGGPPELRDLLLSPSFPGPAGPPALTLTEGGAHEGEAGEDPEKGHAGWSERCWTQAQGSFYIPRTPQAPPSTPPPRPAREA